MGIFRNCGLLWLGMSIGVSISAAAQGPGNLLITDFDDTIRIANTPSHSDAFWRFLFVTDNYAGAAAFYRARHGGSDQISIVSGSPDFAEKRILRQLREAQFPTFFSSFFRNYWKGPDLYQFKLGRLRQLVAEQAGEVLLLGDDTNSDHLVYREIAQARPVEKTRIYIHQIRGLSLPADETPYSTFFEVAYREFLLGKMEEKSVLEIAEDTLQAKAYFVVPDFAHCPTRVFNCVASRSAPVNDACFKVESRLAKICSGHEIRFGPMSAPELQLSQR